jgi:uncharacterized protein YkvS
VLGVLEEEALLKSIRNIIEFDHSNLAYVINFEWSNSIIFCLTLMRAYSSKRANFKLRAVLVWGF